MYTCRPLLRHVIEVMFGEMPGVSPQISITLRSIGLFSGGDVVLDKATTSPWLRSSENSMKYICTVVLKIIQPPLQFPYDFYSKQVVQH